MATKKRLMCREHGGIFEIIPKRGRQPVRCKAETPCDRADQPEHKVGDSVTVGGIKFTKHAEYPAENHATPVPTTNPSLPLAMHAKALLEAVGWVVKGRAWTAVDAGQSEQLAYCAEITASREQETLIMTWQDGELVNQHYAMEFVKPSMNGMPGRQLDFDPDELTDSELVRMVRGMKVTWWNTIGNSTESAVVGGNVTIEHIFFATGDEDNTKRIVKFLDHGGGGFRAFHVTALMKVG